MNMVATARTAKAIHHADTPCPRSGFVSSNAAKICSATNPSHAAISSVGLLFLLHRGPADAFSMCAACITSW